MERFMNIERKFTKYAPVFAGILAATSAAKADDRLICPAETGVVAKTNPARMTIGVGDEIRVTNIVDYTAGQSCTLAGGSVSVRGITTAMVCQNLQALPSRTVEWLRQRDCPGFKAGD
jgi:hypothetical protein